MTEIKNGTSVSEPTSTMNDTTPTLESQGKEQKSRKTGRSATYHAENKKAPDGEKVQRSIKKTSKMSWREQITALLRDKSTINHSDTLVLTNINIFDEIDNGLPFTVPISVVTKSQDGRDGSHLIHDKTLIRLDTSIETAPIIDNPSRNSISFIFNSKYEVSPVTVSFQKNTIFDSDNVNKGTSIHLQTDVTSMLNSLPSDTTIYLKNNNKLAFAPGTVISRSGLNTKAKLVEVDDTTTDTKCQGKEQKSRKNFSAEIDREYLSLAKDPVKNEARLQEMVREAARAAGYDSPLLFHGTYSFGFTVFRTQRPYINTDMPIFASTLKENADTYHLTENGKTEIGKKESNNITAEDVEKAYEKRYGKETSVTLVPGETPQYKTVSATM